MGDIFGGGGGGGSGGDETNTTEKALPSPAQIAATREAFNTASGMAGVAKNLPYYAQIASSPSYRQSLQNTANTWSDWMGTAPLDLSQGMPAITEGQFGSVIDAGQMMNDKIAGMSPEIQEILSQWTGPGPITRGGAYAPAVYDPYIQQKPLLHQGTAAQGGVGTIGAGGIPVTAMPGAGTPPPGTGTGTGTPPPGWGQGPSGTGTGTGTGNGNLIIGGKIYRKNAKGKYVLAATPRRYGQGGMGQGGFAARGGNPGQWGSTGPTRNDL